nr:MULTISPECIES: penicillin acylase family protein [unclassified Pseudoalteromonas]
MQGRSKVFSRESLALRFVILVFIPLLIIISYFYLDERETLPLDNITLSDSALSNKVSISRDKYGVPNISAKSDHDAFFAMGYVQAQDRLWQMELQRRLIKGTLSEVFGASTIERDKYMRTLGLADAAKEALKSLGKREKGILVAFSEGVNAYIRDSENLPIEFRVFGVVASNWSPEDSLMVGKLLSYSLSFAANYERARVQAAAKLPVDYLHSIYPELNDQQSLSEDISRVAKLDETLSQLASIEEALLLEHGIGGKFAGSNAWAISGELSASGDAMLANDPHLSFQMPSLWYRASLLGGEVNASGMTIPGLPVIVFGHNAHIAWGGTNMPADTQDLVIVDLNRGGNSAGEKIVQRVEEIAVKADFPAQFRKAPETIKHTVAQSKYGPILDYSAGASHGYALRWTALNDSDTSISALIDLNYASNWEEFRNALQLLITPTINFVYADRLGNIGLNSAGKVPLRKKHSGAIPVNQYEFEWTGYIPWESMPTEFNPKKGYIINANQKHVSEDYPYFISMDWAPSYRAERIASLIEGELKRGHKLSIDTFRSIQGDVLDLGAIDLLNLLRNDYPNLKPLLGELLHWDGDYKSDPDVGAIYQVMIRNLKVKLFHSQSLATQFGGGLTASSLTDKQLLLALQDHELWCSDTSEKCTDEIRDSYQATLVELERKFGARPWSWGELAPRTFAHQPFSEADFSRRIFERQITGAGSLDTVNAAGYRFDSADGYEQIFGAGFRQIMVSSKQEGFKSWYINSTGQSGNIMSPHYDDMIDLYESNQLVTETPQ